VRKPISTKLGEWIEDVRIGLPFFSVDNYFGIRPLVFELEAPKFWGEMTDARLFGYKSLIYEPSLTKFQTNVRTVAVHRLKPVNFGNIS